MVDVPRIGSAFSWRAHSPWNHFCNARRGFEDDERGVFGMRTTSEVCAWDFPRTLKFLLEGRIPTWRLGLRGEVWFPSYGEVWVPTRVTSEESASREVRVPTSVDGSHLLEVRVATRVEGTYARGGFLPTGGKGVCEGERFPPARGEGCHEG